MSDAKLEILLIAKDQATKAFNAVNGRIDRLTRSVGSLHAGLATIAGGITLAGTIAAFNNLTDAASDLEETANKVNTIFGSELAGTLSEWADNAATSMGLAKQEALDAAGTLGYMFDQLGADRKEAVGLSKDMVELAADLSSFHNVAGGTNKVLEDMQSAFRGEYDPIQKYIYTINAAAVEQEALARTGKAGAKELTALDKAMATVAIVTRDAGAAQGDFARTSDQLANQQRILQANLKDLRAELGERLVPAKTEIIGKLNEWIDANDQLLQQDLPRMLENIGKALVNLIGPAAKAAEYIGKIVNVGATYDENLMGQAVDYALQGYLDLEKVLEANDAQLKEMVKTARELSKALSQSSDVDAFSGAEGWLAGLSAGGGSGGAGGGSSKSYTNRELSAFAKGASDYVDLWQAAYEEKYEVMARSYQAQIEFDEQANEHAKLLADARGGDYVDSWQVQMQDAADVQSRGLQAMIDAEEDAMQQMVDLTQHTAELMQENFSDLFFDAMTGELKTLEDYTRAVYNSIARMLSDLLAKQLSEYISGQVMHTGGVVGTGAGGSRSMPAAAFIGAPRLHNGLFRSDEFPAILQRGEQVIPANARRGSGGVTINVINNTDASVQTTERQTASGQEIDVVIDNMGASKIGQRGSAHSKALQQLGVRPPLTQR